MQVPDFFVVGALKCGTTALYTYLSRHPSIFMPVPKEPRFFCGDFKDHQAIRSEAQYASLFAAAQGRLAGEATPHYLYSQVAIQRIMEKRPDARIIAILRNPVFAAPAYHRQLLLGFQEDVEDFATAWRLQDARAGGRSVPSLCEEPKLLQYGAIYSYAAQIERVMRFVPERQFHFIIYEEFFANPQLHYKRLLDFLNVPFDGRTDFPVVNPARRLRSRAFAHLYSRQPALMMTAWRPLSRVARWCGINPSQVIREMNSTGDAPLSLDHSILSEMVQYFAPDIAATSILLGRGLGIWRMAQGADVE